MSYYPNTWNLLSFNLIDNNSNTVQALLNNIQYENNTLVIFDEKYNYYYSENGLWKPEENSFINYDKCYYIKHFGQQKRHLSITGNLIQDKFYKFSKGWNLISFPFDYIIDASNIFNINTSLHTKLWDNIIEIIKSRWFSIIRRCL